MISSLASMLEPFTVLHARNSRNWSSLPEQETIHSSALMKCKIMSSMFTTLVFDDLSICRQGLRRFEDKPLD